MTERTTPRRVGCVASSKWPDPLGHLDHPRKSTDHLLPSAIEYVWVVHLGGFKQAQVIARTWVTWTRRAYARLAPQLHTSTSGASQ